MFTLRLLGGLRLENGSGDPTGRATQRLRLAVLAVLAMAPGRRMTRDRLLALLWPEAGTGEARARLSSALYDMRRLLGDGAIGNHGDELYLDHGSLRVDAEEFIAAVRREDWDGAAALYGGPLLDGVHLADSTGFEEWLGQERDRLHRTFLSVLERLGTQAAARGDRAAAAAHWARLHELEPLSGRWALALMAAMAALQDRAGAIRTGERLQARLQEELGIAPDPAVATLLTHLRAQPDAPVPSPTAEGQAADREVADHPAPLARGTTRWRTAAISALLGSAVLLVAIGLLAPGRGTVAPTPTRVAVFPFAVTGDSSLTFLEDGLVDLLSADLEGIGPFVTVDPHAVLALWRTKADSASAGALARRLGAGRYITGQVFGHGDSVRIHATMREAGTGLLLREARAAGPASTVPGLVDRLTAQFASGEYQGAGDRIASVAALTTLSIPALREFLSGEARFRRGRFDEAIRSYRRAVMLDTTFALAHYRLALAILWGNDPGAETTVHDSLALAHAVRLSERDRALVEAYTAWRNGRGEEAFRRYDALVARYPDDVEAWFQRGETEFHYGPQLGWAIANARVSFSRVVELDPAHWGARWHLALLDAHEGRPLAMRESVRRLLDLGPDSISALEMQLVAGVSRDGGAPPRAEEADELALFGAGWRRAVFLRDWEGAQRIFAAMEGSGRSGYSKRLGRDARAHLAWGRGAWVEAESVLAVVPSLATIEMRVIGALLPGFERPDTARQRVEADLRAWEAAMGNALDDWPGEIANLLRLRGLLAVVNDPAQALATARALESLPVPPTLQSSTRAMARTIDAYLAWRAGHAAETLRHLEAGHHTIWYGWAVTAMSRSRAFERFLRAEALRALGRPEEALGWYRSFDEHAVHELGFLVPALLRSAELNQRLGRGSLAAEQLGRAAALWRDADPFYATLLARQVAPAGAPATR